MSRVTLGLLVALVLSACSGTEVGDSVGSETTTTTAAGRTTPTSGESVSITTTTVVAPADAHRLADAPAVSGNAPIVVAGLDTGAATEVTVVDYDDDFEPHSAPPGTEIDLRSCVEVYPGLIKMDVAWASPAGTQYPIDATAGVIVYAGDVGSGNVVNFVVARDGAMSIVAPGPLGWQEERGTELRWGQWFRAGSTCAIELVASGSRVESGGLEIEAGATALEPTAPEGSLELLLQSEPPQGSHLELLQSAYSGGLKYFADVVYVATDAGTLRTFTERLEADNVCLRLEFTYDVATVKQERGCGGFTQDGAWQSGDTFFATGFGSGWNVMVSGSDASIVDSLMSGLQPYVPLARKELPIVPGGHRLVGWVEFEGEPLLVTLGEQDCSDGCQSPEQFFYVHELTSEGLVRYAYYPAYGYCLLAEEKPWTLAAIAEGSIEIDGADGTRTLVSDSWEDFAVALLPAGGASDVRVLDANGQPGSCLDHLPDPRGGIVDAETSSTTTVPPTIEADTEIVMEWCGLGSRWPLDASTEPVIARTCASSPTTLFGMGRYYPDGEWFTQGGEPIPGAECLIGWHGDSQFGGPCIDEPNEMGFQGGWWGLGDGYSVVTGLVTDETTHVEAVTDRGEHIVVIPDQRMFLLWWDENAELISVVAHTSHGEVDLLALGR